MKKSPLILTLLCTNLILIPSPNAMEDPIVLGSRIQDGRPQIRVLTETGRKKAEFLQESYDQQKERENAFLHPDERSEEDPELAEAIRLSQQTPPPMAQSSSSISIAHEEDDPFLKLALSESAQEHEAQQKKISEEKGALERERLQKKRDEVTQALEEERSLRSAQKDSLFSRIRELREKEQHTRNELMPLLNDYEQPTESFLRIIDLQDEETRAINDQIESLHTEIDSFEEIDTLIHKETLRLIQGEDPRELPWMRHLINFPVSFSEGRENSSLPPIPSSALPNVNFDLSDKK